MADIKKFLDQDGLSLLWGKIESELKTRDDSISNLSTLVGKESVSNQIDSKINALDATVETAAIPENQDGIHVKITEADGKLTAIEAEIEVSHEINAAKSSLEAKIGTVADGKTLADLIADNANAIQDHKIAIDTKVTTLIDSDINKSVRTIANEELAAQLIPSNAAESLNTLQEIAAWIQNHPGDASAMNSAIKALQTKTELGKYTPEGQSEDVEYTTVKAYVEAVKKELATNATGLEGRVKTNEDAIAIINGDSSTAGSINKALADAKSYTDAEVEKIQALNADEINAAIASVKAQQPQS